MEEKKQIDNLGEQSPETVEYPAKIGLELFIPVILIFGILIVSTFGTSSLTEVIMQFGLMFIFISLFFSISYEITGEVLTVTTFFFIKKSILITEITKVVESYNPLSSPAPSLRRLEIYYGKYSGTVISPRDKTKFIAHLKEISPSIKVELLGKKK